MLVLVFHRHPPLYLSKRIRIIEIRKRSIPPPIVHSPKKRITFRALALFSDESFAIIHSNDPRKTSKAAPITPLLGGENALWPKATRFYCKKTKTITNSTDNAMIVTFFIR